MTMENGLVIVPLHIVVVRNQASQSRKVVLVTSRVHINPTTHLLLLGRVAMGPKYVFSDQNAPNIPSKMVVWP